MDDIHRVVNHIVPYSIVICILTYVPIFNSFNEYNLSKITNVSFECAIVGNVI